MKNLQYIKLKYLVSIPSDWLLFVFFESQSSQLLLVLLPLVAAILQLDRVRVLVICSLKTRCKLSDKAYFINLSHKRWPLLLPVCSSFLALHTPHYSPLPRANHFRSSVVHSRHQFIAIVKSRFAF